MTNQTATPAQSPADLAAHHAASHVKPSDRDEQGSLSAKGLAALHRIETELAWSER